MTHIVGVEFDNWFRFRRVRIALRALAYAVEAVDEHDPARSNWIGKSSFVEAPAFAFFGWHRFQADGEAGAEERWIRTGADEGGVAINLSDGSRVERRRRRGRDGFDLEVHTADGRTVGKKGAEEEIAKILGIARDDYFRSAHVRQKEAARFLRDRPGDRMSVVASWLDFDRLEDACQALSKQITTLVADRERYEDQVTRFSRLANDAGEELFLGHKVGSGVDFDALFSAEIAKAAALVEELETARSNRAIWEERVRQAQSSARDAEDLARAEASLKALPVETSVSDAIALVEHREARQKVRDAERLARGEFDGRCPVLPGFACPAKDDLNAGCAKATEALQKAKSEEHDKAKEVDAMAIAKRKAADAQAERTRLQERIDILRPRVAASPKIDLRSEPRFVTTQQLQEARARLSDLRSDLAVCKRSIETYLRWCRDLDKAASNLAVVEKRIGHLRGARLALGKGGAQRRIAEPACRVITSGANARLAARNIDLRISLSWRREGADLASACDGCGCPFPKSGTVRVCSRCNEPRGKAVQDRLDVHLTDRSGAADDLAGLAIQRSACAFLRARRGAPWSTLILDEPFGALDERHREAVAQSLANIVEEDGLTQAFVVAHQPGILESLPGRILIRSCGGESIAEVFE